MKIEEYVGRIVSIPSVDIEGYVEDIETVEKCEEVLVLLGTFENDLVGIPCYLEEIEIVSVH